ncbi:MAG TPA: hypothetical protein VFQ96_05435, partial [Microbacteriaceae bacterium]|nr:hypothetical protein [Microbacteriaceae bacterium]
GAIRPTTPLTAHCTGDATTSARRILVEGSSYRAGDGLRGGCFPTADGYAMLSLPSPRHTTIVGSAELFENGSIGRADNAAAAIGVAGETPTLVWYLPTVADVPAASRPTLAALTPGWVTPTALLLIATALAAIAWRGRRFGPLVTEALPVTARSNETLEGRARLYRLASARGHALESLRIGTLGRLAARLGLPETASAAEVADAAAAAAGQDPGRVRATLIGEAPGGDAHLVRLSERLASLEARVAAALRPEAFSANAAPPPHTEPTQPTEGNA